MRQCAIKKKKISLCIRSLNGDLLYDVYAVWDIKPGSYESYGYLKWKKIFIDENEDLKFNQINKLFPNLTKLIIKSQQPIPKKLNKWRCIPSISVNSKILSDLLNVLMSNECNWSQISIYNPSNTENELNTLIAMHSSVFLNDSFSIKIIDTSAGQSYERCRCLRIMSM